MDDTELAIRDDFLLEGIKAHDAIERLKELGYDFNEAATMIDKWITATINWQ